MDKIKKLEEEIEAIKRSIDALSLEVSLLKQKCEEKESDYFHKVY